MIQIRHLLAIGVTAPLLACSDARNLGSAPEVTRFTQEAPPGAESGTCWGKQVTPAVIETVTRQLLVQPAEVRADGSVTSPAIYKTETVQQIVREREENWFETPCEEQMTEDFIESLQRALSVRGYYVWKVNGQMDARTRTAVRRYQEAMGLNSGILSMAAARQLGLVSVELDTPPDAEDQG